MFRRLAPRFILLLGVLLTALAVLEACHPPPPVLVHSGRIGQRSDEELGSVVAFERFPEEAKAKTKEGFTAIRSIDDWDLAFADVPKKNRPNAPSFDFEKYMMILAYTSDEAVEKLRVRTVIGAPTGVHAYVTETLRGKGCAPKKTADKGVLEIASFPRTDRVIHVHLDVEEAESCDVEQVQGELVCKVVGTSTGLPRLVAGAGQKIDCSANNAPGMYDRNWNFVHLPKGSASKFTVLPEAMHVVFQTDVIGTYELALELSSADRKNGVYRGTVEVTPPSDQLYIELVWSKFDATDDPSTFTRVELRTQEVLEEGGKPTINAKTGKEVTDKAGKPILTKEKLGKLCMLGAEKVATCFPEKVGPNVLMRLSGGTGRFKTFVRYLDERFDGMPVLCARTYNKGKETGEECDNTARKAGSTWTVGIASEKDGTFEDDEPEAPPAAGTNAGDAGAPAPTKW